MTLGTVKAPTPDELREVAADLGMSFSDDDLTQHMAALLPSIAAYNIIDRMPDEKPTVTYPRTAGYRPSGEENARGAWYVKTTVEGAASGKLKGKRVVLKDNVCLAGVPMMNGASTLEGYTPDVDATVATRILDAGGTIVGKAVCEYFCSPRTWLVFANAAIISPFQSVKILSSLAGVTRFFLVSKSLLRMVPNRAISWSSVKLLSVAVSSRARGKWSMFLPFLFPESPM